MKRKILKEKPKKSSLPPDWRLIVEKNLSIWSNTFPEIYKTGMRILHTPEAEEAILALKDAADAAGVDLDIGLFGSDIFMMTNPHKRHPR